MGMEEIIRRRGFSADGTKHDYYAGMLALIDPLRRPVIESAIRTLQLPSGSRGLDAGCGIGLHTVQLSVAVGPAGHVTGLDLSPQLLAYAGEIAVDAGLSERITFRKGDVKDLPFDDDTFDWAWSVDCVGYAPIAALPLVKELARVVKPGGCVGLLAWSSEKLLPGYPRLEARLAATSAGIAPFVEGKSPACHFLRGLGWLREAALSEPAVRTFAGSTHAPLSEDHRMGLQALFEMRWPGVESELPDQDRAEYQRLCLPGSPDFIINHPDYYAFFTYSMLSGRVPYTAPRLNN
jgi:demethylmenaquinone methyltransferase/2-methoxy-6-polyprenyl-1,4-benzoquinol methylase